VRAAGTASLTTDAMVYVRGVLDSLHRRPRGRELAALLAVLSRGRVPSPLAPKALALRAQQQDRRLEELERRDAANAVVHNHLRMREALAQIALGWSLDRHDVPEWPAALGAASRTLLDALGEDGQAAVLAALPRADRELIEASPAVVRSRRLVGYGAARAVPLVLERTRLLAVEPPAEIHAMCRGPDCVAGSIETADLVLGVLERAGFTLAAGARALDFGCSSGRVTRVLAAVRPDVAWLGCDPNRAAIEWAAAELPVAEFFSNDQEPPLRLDSGTLDLVCGISIWSHFDAVAALRWLAEMHRVLRPGGVLVLTAAGLANVAVLTRDWEVPAEYARAAWAALSTTGFWWADAFGENGDWGVAHPHWGSAYLTPEWLLARILPDWSLRLYEPGRLLGVQDVYVLERSGGPQTPAAGGD
jgi:SAM-dependent methyltransferase